jgi:hypothetical protein
MYTRMPFSVKYLLRRGRQHNFSVLYGHSTSASAYVSASVDLPSVPDRVLGVRQAQLFEEFCLGHYENGAKLSPRNEDCQITYSQTLSLLPRMVERARNSI